MYILIEDRVVITLDYFKIDHAKILLIIYFFIDSVINFLKL